MANVRVIVDEHEYSEDQFKKDLIRMFDKYRYADSKHMGESNCNDVNCRECPLVDNSQQIAVCAVGKSDAFDLVKLVYEWAKAHPIITNEDMLKKTFGDDVLSHICSRVFEWEWFDQEYKEPKGGKQKWLKSK